MQKSKKDSVLRNYFLGIEIRKTSATFPRAGGVWGGMRAGISEILAGRATRKLSQKMLKLECL